MWYQKIAAFLIISFGWSNLFGQLTLNGHVRDTAGHPVGGSMIMIKDTAGRIVSYAKADTKGYFAFGLSAGKYAVEVRAINYNPWDTLIRLTHPLYLKIHLQPKSEELKSIRINVKAYEQIRKSDTIKYNLKAIRDGSEQTLRDLIKKLPGAEVEGNRITINGQPVDKLLINGKDLFGRNQKLALDNIESKAVKGISFYENYHDPFSLSPEGFPSGQNALDISLDEQYTGSWKGNLSLQGGYRDKFGVHNNTYYIGTEFMAYAIADWNNLGKEAFGLNDYISLMWNAAEGNRINIPSFMLQKDKAASKLGGMLSLNLHGETKRHAQWQIRGIYHAGRAISWRNTQYVFYDPTLAAYTDSTLQSGHQNLWIGTARWQRKWSSKWATKIDLKAHASTVNDNMQIGASSLTVEQNRMQSRQDINGRIHHIYRPNDKWKWETDLSGELSTTQKALNFTYLSAGSDTLGQTRENAWNRWRISSKLLWNLSSRSFWTFTPSYTENQGNVGIRYYAPDLSGAVLLYKEQTGMLETRYFWRWGINGFVQLGWTFFKSFYHLEDAVYTWGGGMPFLQISKNWDYIGLMARYKVSHFTPSPFYWLSQPYYEKYNRLVFAQAGPDVWGYYRQAYLSVHSYGLLPGWEMYALVSFWREVPALQQYTSISHDLYMRYLFYAHTNDRMMVYGQIGKKFYRFPVKIKYRVDWIVNDGFLYLDSLNPIPRRTVTWQHRWQWYAGKTGKPWKTEGSVLYRLTGVFSELSRIYNEEWLARITLHYVQPRWEAKFSYDYLWNPREAMGDRHLLSGMIQYHRTDHLTFFVEGYNLLYLNGMQYIDFRSYADYYTWVTESRLPGYLTFGLKWYY